MVQAHCRHRLCPGLCLILLSPALSSPKDSALSTQKTLSVSSLWEEARSAPCGHCHVLVFVSQRCLSGPWAAGAGDGAELKGLRAVWRLFPSLVLCSPDGSALAPSGSSALECPQEGCAEPLPSLSTTAQCSYSRSGGCLPWLSPLPLWGTLLSCIVRAFSSLGSTSHRLRPSSFVWLIIQLLPLQSRRWGIKTDSSSQYLQISITMEVLWARKWPPREQPCGSRACAWSCRGVKLQMSSQRLKLNRRDVAELGSLGSTAWATWL